MAKKPYISSEKAAIELKRIKEDQKNIIIEKIIFCKDYHFVHLAKLLKLDVYPEIKNVKADGNFTISILTSISHNKNLKRGKSNIITAIKVKKENLKVNSIDKCRKVYNFENVLYYPLKTKEIKELKFKYKLKLIQILL